MDFSPLKDSEAKAWAKSYLKTSKAVVDDQVLNEIINLVGTDVQTLANELDKLGSAALDSGRIDMELVDELIGRTRELSISNSGTICSPTIENARWKRFIDCSTTAPSLSCSSVLSPTIIGALGKHLLTRGGREEVFRNISMPPFKRDAYISNLQRSDAKKIARGIQLTAAADLAIKTSQATPRLQLEMLVCELAS